MKYEIICAKNTSFWNKVIIAIAMFVAIVCVFSMFVPTKNVTNNSNSQTTLYQEVTQIQAENTNATAQNRN